MDKIKLYGKLIKKSSAPGKIGVEYDVEQEPHVAELCKKYYEKSQGWVYVTMNPPVQPMTTGPRSQQARFRGGCAAIGEQLGMSERLVAESLKSMAASEGYPTEMGLDGNQRPISTSEASTEDAKILLDMMQLFADTHELWLWEYDEDNEPYKTVGGRGREEMKKWNSGKDQA
jgi:hypothetical protein